MRLSIIGYAVRNRFCKPNRRCLTGSVSTQSNYCFLGPCTKYHGQNSSVMPDPMIENTHEYKLINKDFQFIFIFIFPVFFISLCLPLCVFYYIYELDFKIHMITSQTLSMCNRHFDTKRRRINTRQ